MSNKVLREIRICALPGCNTAFEVSIHSNRKYCSRECGWDSLKEVPSPKKGKTYEEMYGKNKANEIKGKIIKGNRNKVISQEHRDSIGKKNSESMKRLWQDPDYIAKQMKARKEGNIQKSFTIKCLWQNLEYVMNQMKAREIKPNKSEKFLTKFLQQHFPNQWKYVGNFKYWINGANPDFININGQKKIIEMNGDWWHGEKITRRTKEEEEKQRIERFAKYGYKTLVIWEHELKDTHSIMNRIEEFING
jgi:G:T-mismatch repair DNA endonuclease (very short patch repair protein)